MTGSNDRALRSSNFLAEPEPKAASWEAHLLSLIDPLWRDGEFASDQLILTLDPDDRMHTIAARICPRPGCGNQGHKAGTLCSGCAKELSNSSLSRDEFMTTPAPSRERVEKGCLAPGCDRSHHGVGLCVSHFNRWVYADRPGDVPNWASSQTPISPRSREAATSCAVSDCASARWGSGLCRRHHRSWIDAGRPQLANWGMTNPCVTPGCAKPKTHISLCDDHNLLCRSWNIREGQSELSSDHQIDLWLSRAAMPAKITSNVIAFGLLEHPLALELVAAAQAYDARKRGKLDYKAWRSIITASRNERLSTAVGAEIPTTNSGAEGLAAWITTWVQREHANWTGREGNTDVIRLETLTYNKSNTTISDRASVDLSTVTQPWLKAPLRHWILFTSHDALAADVRRAAQVFTVASQVIGAADPHHLSARDMTRIVAAVRARWTRQIEQRDQLRTFDRVLRYARGLPEFRDPWEHIPNAFIRDTDNNPDHRPLGSRTRNEDGTDEPFRYVPAPIVSHLIDNLAALRCPNPSNAIGVPENYSTIEAQVTIFIAYACGRRPVETLTLSADPIRYDSAGDPYLVWQRAKTGKGSPKLAPKRLPVGPEVVNVIHDWQQFKSAAGIRSEWLFPNMNNRRADHRVPTRRLNERIKTLVASVPVFTETVEGAEGRRIQFDMSAIDAYSFRHAFAQRCADETDEHGNHVTPPDVLMEFMDHSSYNTTMGYYEVTAKRQKSVMAQIPVARFDIYGHQSNGDRERDAYTGSKPGPHGGHCVAPQYVQGNVCPADQDCELCPKYRVDAAERRFILARQRDLRQQLEYARMLKSPQIKIECMQARIDHAQTMIDAIDTYLAALDEETRLAYKQAEAHLDEFERGSRTERIDIGAVISATSA